MWIALDPHAVTLIHTALRLRADEFATFADRKPVGRAAQDRGYAAERRALAERTARRPTSR